MPRTFLFLALFLFGAPLPAHAAIQLQASTSEARGGDVITFSWSGLPEDVEEMELEYSVGGARWVRLSPELESEERHYRWRSPKDIAGTVRVQLRHGRRHEEAVGAEVALRFVADAQLVPGQGVRAEDAWDLDRPVHGPAGSSFRTTHPAYAITLALAEPAVTSALDLPEPARHTARHHGTRHASHASPVPPRTFESPRMSPLRN